MFFCNEKKKKFSDPLDFLLFTNRDILLHILNLEKWKLKETKEKFEANCEKRDNFLIDFNFTKRKIYSDLGSTLKDKKVALVY